MIMNIKDKVSYFNYELNYRVNLWQHTKNLPPIEERDRIILDSLKSKSIYITNLAELGFTSTSELLDAAHSLLPSMGKANYDDSGENPPEICIVTDLPEFYNWGKEQRLFNIIENYIGLPVAYHGVHLRKDFANKNQFATLLWHRDIEDRRVIKIMVYLNDVEEKHGPFEYVPSHLTSKYTLNYYRIKNKIKNSGGINDETLNQIVPKSAWKSCPGKAGTVIIADTRRLLHHGTLRTQERSTLFFAYTANPPKQPQLCTHFWDDSYPKPEFYLKSEETRLSTLTTLTK
ncbi:phytanoyl-CoA dioxygenase family protein [Nostocaceae cyanobacterium CENA369]|uniref:Phytanoyl-CoA dioxygenase family protein n=1 Tax=Dendronalium phyllosphericum CENA369 TaxID=1725256 RepID=A0A8J7I0M8_9NOST|nr:phytanoyl-CoA dioxygenase family protein [Dendronalium phyllosphericum]MBH8571938.1 phytanoyl-CoA dioxygenase family protein [Dendronalium phyllosphericum CENA369]